MFHTPLGDFIIARGGTTTRQAEEKLFSHLKEKFGLVEIVPASRDRMGESSPVYAVTKDLDGNAIPMPKMPLQFNRLNYDQAQALKGEWEAIKPDLTAIKEALATSSNRSLWTNSLGDRTGRAKG